MQKKVAHDEPPHLGLHCLPSMFLKFSLGYSLDKTFLKFHCLLFLHFELILFHLGCEQCFIAISLELPFYHHLSMAENMLNLDSVDVCTLDKTS